MYVHIYICISIYIYNIYIYTHIHATVYVIYMYIYVYIFLFSQGIYPHPIINHHLHLYSVLLRKSRVFTLQPAFFLWPCIKWHSSHASFSSSEALRLRLWGKLDFVSWLWTSSQEQQKQTSGIRDGKIITYPLVNIQKTIENHHF